MKGLLFTYALTYGGAAASLYNPFVGLLIYICFAIVRPEAMWYWSVPAGNYSRIVAIALVVGWAIHGFGNWEFGRAKPVVYALLAFWGWAILSAMFAPNGSYAWGFVETKSKIFLPFLIGATLIDSLDRLKQVAWTIALSQGYVAYELNRSYWDGFNRMHELGFGGMDNNSQAVAMVAGAGLAFFLGLNQEKLWRKLLLFAAAAFMVHCCMFAFSRGAMLSLCIMGIVTGLFLLQQPKHWWALAAAVIVAARLAGPEVINRFTSTFVDAEQRDGSAQSRLDMWANCLDVMFKNPILGAGPDHWPLFASQYGWPAGKEAHSLWMQTGAEMGVIGLGLLLAFYGLCILGLWRLWQSRTLNYNLPQTILDTPPMVISSIVGFGIAAQFVSLEGLEIPYYIVLIGVGALRLSQQYEVGVDDTREDDSAECSESSQPIPEFV